MSVSWRDDLSVGVELIDNQHKELLSRFDSLLKACKEGNGRDEVLGLLEFLDQYVISHFDEEEKIQQKSNFPDYTPHKLEHEAFKARIAEIKSSLNSEGEVLLDHVLDTNKLLLDWLIRHISVRDRAVGRHLQRNGLV